MTKGSYIRLVIFLLCIGVYGWHAINQFVYRTGIRAQNDIGAVIAAHLNKEYVFSLETPISSMQNHKLFYRVYTKETFYVIQIRLLMRNLPVSTQSINAASAMMPANPLLEKIIDVVKESGSKNITGNIELIYDNKTRFSGANGTLDALGISCRVESHVDHLGLHSHVAIPALEIIEDEVHEDFDADNFHGPVLLLPPKLKNGDILNLSFLDKVLTIDVGLEEVLKIGPHKLVVKQAVVSYEKRPYARLWFDENGVIYQIAFEGKPVKLNLLTIKNLAGDELWHKDH